MEYGCRLKGLSETSPTHEAMNVNKTKITPLILTSSKIDCITAKFQFNNVHLIELNLQIIKIDCG